MTSDQKCDHPNFKATVDVARITSNTDETKVIAFKADVDIKCAECKESFVFVGLPQGLTQQHPTVSISGETMSAPIEPISGWTYTEPVMGYGVNIYTKEDEDVQPSQN